MTLPLLFFLAREEKNRWLRIALRVCFACAVASVLLTYSRGGLLGLSVVLLAITLRTRHKVIGAVLLVSTAFFVLTFAPQAWMDRMGRMAAGDLDASANQRLVAWETAWHFVQDYPLTGGAFDALPDVNIFQRYQRRPLPLGYKSTAPHSVYFQLLADQGFVGFGLFLALVGACFWTLVRVRRAARSLPSARWLVNYTLMIEISILGFMTSGAFLGFLYLDVIYQVTATVVVIKIIFEKEMAAHLLRMEARPSATLVPEEVAAPA